MDTLAMITELQAERDRLDRAITALQGGKRRGRPPGTNTAGTKRHMSAAARRRISLAQKKRWAVLKTKKA